MADLSKMPPPPTAACNSMQIAQFNKSLVSYGWLSNPIADFLSMDASTMK